MRKNINLFLYKIENYPHSISINDQSEIKKLLKKLPAIIAAHIGKGLMKAATGKIISKHNRAIIEKIFMDVEIAKTIFSI